MRKPRYYYESNFYHVMVQGDEKKYIFQSSKNKEKYLYYLKHNEFLNSDDKIDDICDLTENDRNSIIKSEKSVTKFLEDEYSQSDILEAFEESQNMFSSISDKDERIAKQYKHLKENCKITDVEIAKLLNMSRSTLNLKLKKAGLK